EPTTLSSTGSTLSGYSSSSTVAPKPNSTLARTATTGTWRALVRASQRGASSRWASEWIMREAPYRLALSADSSAITAIRVIALAAPGMLATSSTAANGDFSAVLFHGTTAMITPIEPM